MVGKEGLLVPEAGSPKEGERRPESPVAPEGGRGRAASSRSRLSGQCGDAPAGSRRRRLIPGRLVLQASSPRSASQSK